MTYLMVGAFCLDLSLPGLAVSRFTGYTSRRLLLSRFTDRFPPRLNIFTSFWEKPKETESRSLSTSYWYF